MKDAWAPLTRLPTIEFEDVLTEGRWFLLLNLAVRKSLVTVPQLKEVVEFIGGMDAKVLVYDNDQFVWLDERAPERNDGIFAVFHDIWLAITKIDCTMLVLKYPIVIRATIDPEGE